MGTVSDDQPSTARAGRRSLRLRRAVAPAAGLLLLGAAIAYFVFWFDPGADIHWQPGILAGMAGTILVGMLFVVTSEFLVLRAAGMQEAGFFDVFRVASIASLSTYLGVFGGIPARLALYRTLLRLPASASTAALLYLTAMGTLVPAAIAVVFLASRFPKLAAGCAIAAALLTAVIAALMAARGSERLRAAGNRLPAFTRRLQRFVSETALALAQFRRGLTLRVALTMLVSQALVGVQTRLMLELWGQSASIFELTGVQAASYALGRISLLPLGFGVRDASLVSLMVQLGVSTDVAIAVAALDRGLGLGIRLLIGGVSLLTLSRGRSRTPS